ncbi:MAG TPA: DUF2970 domain-containing protein [Nitrococcus sp.]|nr:DUF2970 domain-containing protein [Nitrococcus sp.]
MSTDTRRQTDAPDAVKLTIRQVIHSVLAAGFGVQSEAARKRDFTYGRPLPFIIVGAIATVLFILTIVTIVRLVLFAAGA